MSAPDLSPAEAEIVARFDAAPTPPEVLREQVARALQAVDDCVGSPVLPWDGEDTDRAAYLRLTDAALAVFRGQQDPAVQRVLALAAKWDKWAAEDRRDAGASSDAEDAGRWLHSADRWADSAAAIRAAINGDGR